MARYLSERGGHLADFAERDKLLYWYVHTFLWGRYAGSTESVLNQDLGLIEQKEHALDRLIAQLRQGRGDLRLRANDFVGWSRGARFYPLLYMLTRVWHAKDLGTGVDLSAHLLGNMNSLEVHHIFPKALLYQHGCGRAEANAIANFTFLTKDTNLAISDHDPAEYLADIAVKFPGAIESHWIPMDRELWKVENYEQFLAARRELLAAAANEFLDSLYSGDIPEEVITNSVLDRSEPPEPASIASSDGQRDVDECARWIAEQGLPSGDVAYELVDPGTGNLIASFDLAWPDGLQPGLSAPVALVLDGDEEIEKLANSAGFRAFTAVEAFRDYVQSEVLAIAVWRPGTPHGQARR